LCVFAAHKNQAAKSDALVDKALKRAGDALGAGVANVLTTTGCDCVVVGETRQNLMSFVCFDYLLKEEDLLKSFRSCLRGL
jgi:predicted NBD/HSP70 family sugar kinase